MGKLKQIILFLLVVITIYSTMLFYLLMSVHADSRLQEIDYLEKTKPETQNKVLYIDRLMIINDRYNNTNSDSSISPSRESVTNYQNLQNVTLNTPDKHSYSSPLLTSTLSLFTRKFCDNYKSVLKRGASQSCSYSKGRGPSSSITNRILINMQTK